MCFKQFLNGIMLNSVYVRPVMGSTLDIYLPGLDSRSASSWIRQVNDQQTFISSFRPGRRALKSMTIFSLNKMVITAKCKEIFVDPFK